MDQDIENKKTGEYVVCPKCGSFVHTSEVVAIECRQLGLPLAWRFYCDSCNCPSIVPYRGIPALFEITANTLWTMPRA